MYNMIHKVHLSVLSYSLQSKRCLKQLAKINCLQIISDESFTKIRDIKDVNSKASGLPDVILSTSMA
jgi:hypothetical protein